GVADYLGLSSAIGAFVAGIGLAQTEGSENLRRHVHPLMNFFLAIFFISIGAQMELASAVAYWRAAVALGLFALIINPLICLWLISACGYGRRTSFLAGI